jgi:hypothetical protein
VTASLHARINRLSCFKQPTSERITRNNVSDIDKVDLNSEANVVKVVCAS